MHHIDARGPKKECVCAVLFAVLCRSEGQTSNQMYVHTYVCLQFMNGLIRVTPKAICTYVHHDRKPVCIAPCINMVHEINQLGQIHIAFLNINEQYITSEYNHKLAWRRNFIKPPLSVYQPTHFIGDWGLNPSAPVEALSQLTT